MGFEVEEGFYRADPNFLTGTKLKYVSVVLVIL